MFRWTTSILVLSAACVAALLLIRLVGPSAGEPETSVEIGAGVVVAPAAIDFGRMPIGAMAERMLTATNNGEERVELLASTDEPYSSSRSKFALRPGETRELLVRFNPRESGLVESALRFESEGFADGAFEVPLLGVAHLPPEIHVEPLTLEFGDVQVGTSSSGFLQLENRGEGELEIAQIGAPAPFDLLEDPIKLAPGERRRLRVGFSPQEIGARNRQFAIRSNDPDRSRVFVRLGGGGVDHAPLPVAEVAPLALDFGDVRVGGEKQRWFQLRNAGSDPLQVTSVQISPPWSGSPRSRRIEAGQLIVFPVTYRPAGTGRHQGHVRVLTNDPETPELAVGLRGFGSDRIETVDEGGTRTAGPLFGGEEIPEDSPMLDPEYTPDPVADGSLVAVGTYTAEVADAHVEAVTFDPSRGTLALEGIQLPTIEAALGEYFEFGETSWQGRVGPDGEITGDLFLSVIDRSGQATDIRVPLTTGTSIVNHGGTVFSFDGRPFAWDGTALLTGAATFMSGTARGRTFEILLGIQAGLTE